MSIDLIEYRDKGIGLVGDAFNYFLDTLVIYPGLVLVLGVLLLAICVVGTYRMARPKKKRRGIGTMAQRKAALARLYADVLGDAMLDLFVKGKISKQEYRRDLQLLGKRTGLTDLIRKSRNPFAIRHTVMKNAEVMLNEMEKIKPGIIPGPKPGEEVPLPVPDPPKKWTMDGKTLARRKVA